MKKGEYIERLKKALAEGGVPEGLRMQLSKGAELIITGNESETEIKGIIDAQVGLGKSLSEEMRKGATPPSTAPAANQEKTLSAAEIQKIVADGIAAAERAKSDAAKQLSEKKAANVKLLSDTITAAQGIEEEQKKTLAEALAPTITGFETEEQIKAIVGAQVKLAEGNISQAKLAAMGYPVSGHVRVAEGEGVRGAKKLAEKLDEIIGYTKMPVEKRYPKTGKLSNAQKEAAEKVLAHFDRVHEQALAMEAKFGNKMLAGGEVGIADTVLPYTVSRIAIREALYDLQAANIIAIEIEANAKAPTTFIPFVKRQAGNPSRKQITVFEGQPIPYAGLLQDQETAFVNPRKLATKFTNEVAFFTRSSVIDYDAMRDNMALLSRMLSEGVEYLNLNEMVMAADEYSVVAVVAEDLSAGGNDQVDGTNTIFQLANWPLVQPRKVFDLKGTQIGNTVNPIVVTYQGGAIGEYDGTGTQGAGTYYQVTNWTLGQFKLVNQAGALVTPGAAATLTVSYSYTTNVLKFDKNLPANTKYEDHLNGLLRHFGRRKATLYQDRFATPNFAYMSAVMNNILTEASQFESARAKGGTGLTDDGNLEPIKAISCFGSNVPLEQLGDQRLIIGQRFTTMQKIAKPWTMEPTFIEVTDPTTGKFTGEKHTYGEQYDAIHTPEMLKQQYTEIVAYDSTTDIGPF